MYPKAVEANLIWTKNTSTTVMLTFNRSQTPYNIYIPREPADTNVYKD